MSEREEQERLPSLWSVLAMPVSLAVTSLALAFGLVIGLAYDDGGEAAPPTTQPSLVQEGEEVFATAGCGGCHTLSAAGTSGSVGPSLDETTLSEDQIAAVVSDGRGNMPGFSGQLGAEEIDAVAAYVSASARAP